MPFKPVEERRTVEDVDLGISVSVVPATANNEYLRVTATGFRVTPLKFIMVRFPSYGAAREKQDPTMLIRVSDLESMLQRAGLRDYDENTNIIKLIVEGIYKFNETWPQVRKAIISSDFEEAIANGLRLSFSLQSGATLAAPSGE